MDFVAVLAGFLIGVGVSVLAPPFWRKLQAGFEIIVERITRPPDRPPPE